MNKGDDMSGDQASAEGSGTDVQYTTRSEGAPNSARRPGRRQAEREERERRAAIESAAGYDDQARATLGLGKPKVVAKVNTNNAPNSWGAGEGNERALEVVYRTFGSQFVVAATEKKKRNNPVKRAVVEAPDKRLQRERLERRKGAMKRLMDRRESQQQNQLISSVAFN